MVAGAGVSGGILGLRPPRAAPRAAGASLPGTGRLRDVSAKDPGAPPVSRSPDRGQAAALPRYAFFVVEAQWHSARWSVGVLGLIMNGLQPAKVPDRVIDGIRGRERNGLIELAPPPSLRRGARVRILAGPFRDHLAIFADMKPRERVEILLQLLGGEQRVTLAKKDIEAVR